MEPTVNRISQPYVSTVTPPVSSGTKAPRGRDTEFAQVLAERLNTRSIALSLHAADRLVQRGVEIDETTVDQINEAFDMARQKGSRNALFLLDDLAVVASVPTRSIITALDARTLSNGVFTQIDSAVVLHRNVPEAEK